MVTLRNLEDRDLVAVTAINNDVLQRKIERLLKPSSFPAESNSIGVETNDKHSEPLTRKYVNKVDVGYLEFSINHVGIFPAN